MTEEKRSFDERIETEGNQQVTLPDGDFVANAAFARDGADLYLTAPDGHTVMVEGYFAQNPAPDLVTPDGARLSPALVEAFVPPQHAGQYASAAQTMTDASPAGKITDVVGEAFIVHADGTRTPATPGAPVYPGDVIETSAEGAVNILFADNTTFAISESARLSVDEFTYNAAEQSGSTFFSMLQGMFVYTSGLIGKNDPGSVNIETPVGSIGIRGTVVAGEIAPAGQESTITLVDGAIVLTNGGGTMELSSSFETASLSSYQQSPVNMGQMSTDSFTQTYNSVSTVAGDTFNHLDNFSSGADSQRQAPQNAPASGADGTQIDGGTGEQAPPAEAAPAPSGTTSGDASEAAPAPADATVATVTAEAPPAPAPATMTMVAAPLSTAPASSFTSASTTIGPANTFQSGTQTPGDTSSGAETTAMKSVLPPPPPPPPTPTPPPPADTASPPPPPAPSLLFDFAPWYRNSTAVVSDDGIAPFMMGGPLAASVIVGRIVATDLPAGVTLSIVGDVDGSTVRYNMGTSTNFYDTQIVNNPNVFTFNSTTGDLILNDPGAMLGRINDPFSFRVEATAADSTLVASCDFSVIFKAMNFISPDLAMANIFVGDPGVSDPANPFSSVAASDDNINGTLNASDLMMGRDGNDILNGLGGRDTLLGGGGNDKMIAGNLAFHYIDGGAGEDTLVLGDVMHASLPVFDFTSMAMDLNGIASPGASITGVVRNIETIELGATSGGSVGARIRLDIRDVFQMTDDDRTLVIKASDISSVTGSTVQIADAAGMGFRSGGGALNVVGGTIGGGDVTLQGTYNGETVTLIIQQTNTNGNTLSLT